VSKALTWDNSPWIVLFFFFLPYMVHCFMGPAGEFITVFGLPQFPYRATQILFGVTLLGCALVLMRKHNLRLSPQAKFVSLVLLAAYGAQLATLVLRPNPVFSVEVLQLTIQFLITFIGFDLMARRLSFEDFARAAGPLTLLFLFASTVHLQFFPIKVWGRSLFWGLHPNYGGELIAGAAMLLAFAKQPAIRWIGYAMAIYCLMQVQARASLLAVLVVVGGVEAWGQRGMFTRMLAIGAAGLVAVCLVVLVSPSAMTRASDFVANQVFMANNPNRGLGSGFVGRDETWAVAIRDVSANPVSGKGMQQSGQTLLGLPIHNGYLKNFAEFGVIFGLALNLMLILGTFWAFRQDRRLGFVMLACHVEYFFAPRNVNLSVFPLMMWLAILPWKAPAMAFARQRPEPAPAQPAGLAPATR
jgi:hypothetical protein